MDKELIEVQENEQKQKVRMAELQEELQQTIKRIEQLQRGGGGFGSGVRAGSNNNSGARRQYGSGNRAVGSKGNSPYGGSGVRNSSNGSNTGPRKYGNV